MKNNILKVFNFEKSYFLGNKLYLPLIIDTKKAIKYNLTKVQACIHKKKIDSSTFNNTKDQEIIIENKDEIEPRVFNSSDLQNNNIVKNFLSKRIITGSSQFNFPKRNVYIESLSEGQTQKIVAVISKAEISNAGLSDSDDHFFRIYLLNKDEEIIDYTEYNSDIKIEDYPDLELDDLDRSQINTLLDYETNFLNIDFRSYIIQNKNVLDGPSVNTSSNSDLSITKINLSYLDEVIISGDYSDFDLKNSLIQNYENNLIKTLKEYFDENSNEFNVEAELSIVFNGIKKSKVIYFNKEVIKEYYKSYAKYHKQKFVLDIFQNKISPNSEIGLVSFKSINLDNLSEIKEFFPYSGVEFLGQNSSIIKKIYLSENKNTNNALTSNNSKFDINTIFSTTKENKYFFRNLSDFITKIAGIQVYPIVPESEDSVVVENRNRQTHPYVNNFDLSVRAFDTNDNYLISKSEIIKKVESLKKLNYETESNDNLFQEVIDNTLVQITSKVRQGLNNFQKEDYKKLSDILNLNTMRIRSSADRGDIQTTSIRMITFPKNTLPELFNSSVTEEFKEEIAKFLNEISPESFVLIDKLIRNKLFKNQINDVEKRNIYKKIFNATKNDISKNTTRISSGKTEYDQKETDEAELLESYSNRDSIIYDITKNNTNIFDQYKINKRTISHLFDYDNVSFLDTKGFLFNNEFSLESNKIKIKKKNLAKPLGIVINKKEIENLVLENIDEYDIEAFFNLNFKFKNIKDTSEIKINNYIVSKDNIVLQKDLGIEKSINDIVIKLKRKSYNIHNNFYKDITTSNKNSDLIISSITERYVLCFSKKNTKKIYIKIQNNIPLDLDGNLIFTNVKKDNLNINLNSSLVKFPNIEISER